MNTCFSLKDICSGLRQFLATESPLKMIKNTFYSTLKDIFVLEIFNVFFNFLAMWENGLIRKLR